MTGQQAFDLVARCIDAVVPDARAAGYVLRGCPELEDVHRKVPRVFAHVFHHPGAICVVDDFEQLPDPHKVGILLHEFGHLLTPSELDADADLWAELFLGIDIDYVDTLQHVDPTLLMQVSSQIGIE